MLNSNAPNLGKQILPILVNGLFLDPSSDEIKWLLLLLLLHDFLVVNYEMRSVMRITGNEISCSGHVAEEL